MSASAAPSLERRRESAIALLRELYGTDLLDIDDFSGRTERVLAAGSDAEINAALNGLPEVASDRTRQLEEADSRLAHALRPHLLPGEELLWTGQPDPSKHFTPADAFLIPFSLLWGGFACFWEASVLSTHTRTGTQPPIFFAVFGMAFVLVGLYFIFGRFIYKAMRARRTIYAVTDRRLLSLQHRKRGDTLDAAFINSIPTLSTRVRSDGSGSLTFGTNPGIPGMYANTGMDLFARPLGAGMTGLYDIPDATRTAALVNKLRHSPT